MAYLSRKIDEFLESWHADDNRLPLIVKGPRQVGKTESIRHFAERNYKSVVEINFIEEPRYRHIIDDGYRAEDIVRNISRLDPSKRFVPGQTLLFFDELQDFPEIATALKFFKLDGRYDVICSGSMLGISYGRIESNSVGYKSDYEMRSMDFEEFLWAKGYDGDLVDDLFDHAIEGHAFSDLDMELLSGLFLDYCSLGGMPAIVEAYVRTGTFEQSLQRQRQLLLDYREDITKYAVGMDKTRILNVFDQIPSQLARENKKFQISKVARGARFKDYRGCVEWLEMAGMVNVCRCLRFPELPLGGNADEGKFKLYLADTGMLVASLDDEASEDLRANRNLGVYKGAVYENLVGEALSKCGMRLYYYKRENSTLEEDFFGRTKDRLVPIEVKATTGTAKSLRTLIESPRYPDITWGLKLHKGNVGVDRGVRTLPYFCAFLVRRLLAEL